MSLIEIKNLSVSYPSRRGVFKALQQVSLTLQAGEIHGLVGESGAGKSTIGSAIMGLLEHPGEISGGEIHFCGESIGELSDSALQQLRGSAIGMIFQDPLTSLNPLMSVGQQLIETICYHLKLSKSAAKERALALLKEVDIPQPEVRINQYPHQFSGGMRQRVVIALALCSEPKLLIADEPTTALDVSVQAQILELIKRLVKKHQLGVILVTHDMGVIAQTTDKVTVLFRGKVVESGPTQQLLAAPEHRYTQSLLSAVPRSDKKMPRFTQVSWLDGAKPLDKTDFARDWQGENNLHQSNAVPMLEVKNISLSFKAKSSIFSKTAAPTKAVDDVSFTVNYGEVFGIVGESGSGKSTIARLITRLYNPDSGSIHYRGESVVGKLQKQHLQNFRRRCQMIFQDPYSSINPRMRVRDIIAEPILLYGLNDRNGAYQRVAKLLDYLGLEQAAAVKYPHEFSGGQRQRISIARALATEPSLLICDEPTSALDVSIQAQILNILKDLQSELGLTMIFISHDLPVIRQMCDKVAVMKAGKIVELTESETLFTAAQHSYSQSLLKLMPDMHR
ncbi:MAG: ABC transporter ATP-binding protein [Pseudomonadales bacterium]|nr:ABC transporter ATP-binding protein [Pseudomonadales bacterium]NRA16208.1 ABC transporter ATP-binding protein [Oceanospirillaceae bacterium]